jgi:hypothetical protein
VGTTGGGRRTGPAPHLWWTVAALGLAAAFLLGWRSTAGVIWPENLDLYREMASARSMQRGLWLADPYYLGERIWYNPLLPAIGAVLGAATGIPLPHVFTQGGVVLGLVGPIGFFVLARRLFGRSRATLSLLAFLFLTCGDWPNWAAASYSPWLMPMGFAQGLFYLVLATLVSAPDHGRRRRDAAIVGGWLGLVFLAHTAPALLLGTIAVGWIARGGGSGRARWRAIAILLGTAFVVSLPLSGTLLFHYHLRTLNPLPTSWRSELLAPESLLSQLPGLLRPADLLSLLGLGATVLRGRPPARAHVVRWWLALSVFLFAVGSASPWLDRAGVPLPQVLPAHHFFFYVHAVRALCFGQGALLLVHILVRATGRRRLRRPSRRALAALAATVLLCLAQLPVYLSREDFQYQRTRSLAWSAQPDRTATWEWIDRHARSTDVYYVAPEDAMRVVGPAGAKVVLTDAYFSNPYVDYAERARAFAAMGAALDRCDRTALASLLARYGVTHLVLAHGAADRRAHCASDGARRLFATGRYRIYSLD